MEKLGCEVVQIDESTWRIENGFVRFFLLKGEDKALLIDTGLDVDHVRELAEKTLGGDSSLPLELLNTHSDGDHCNGNREFERFYMHEADVPLYRMMHGSEGEIDPVKDGDIIDLGGRPLEIIEIPGHSKGSIAILDIDRRVLFPGDSVQTGDIFMFGGHRDLDAFPASLIKLQDMEDRFDTLYPSHAAPQLAPDYIGKVFDACEQVLHGEVEPKDRVMFDGTPVHAYETEACTFLIDKDRVFEAAEE